MSRWYGGIEEMAKNLAEDEHKRFTRSPSNTDVITTSLTSTRTTTITSPSPAILKNISTSNSQKLLCWVHTTSVQQETRVPAVNQTWFHRCDYSIFFSNSSINDSSINNFPLWHTKSDKHLAAHNKTIRAWTYVFHRISKKFDWYYKADDDTYLIVENLRKFLKNYDPNKPHFFGARFKLYIKNGYNSGSGYVFSYETVRLLNEAFQNDSNFCKYSEYEDLGIAKCLAKLNIYPEKTVDEGGNHRFLPYNFREMYYNTLDAPGWLKDPIKEKFAIFSPNLIQLHHVAPDDMRLIDAMLYRVRNGTT